jgi:hypothetical protein
MVLDPSYQNPSHINIVFEIFEHHLKGIIGIISFFGLCAKFRYIHFTSSKLNLSRMGIHIAYICSVFSSHGEEYCSIFVDPLQHQVLIIYQNYLHIF